MTQEDKLLLLKDLCGRLPYGVICHANEINIDGELIFVNKLYNIAALYYDNTIGKFEHCQINDIKPYLRPMSSMTEEEKRHISKMMCLRTYDDGVVHDMNYPVYTPYYVMDDCLSYLRSIHVDYSGLIEKGLALEATKGLYKIN